MTFFRMPVGFAIILLSSLFMSAVAQGGDALNELVYREDGPPQALVYKARTGEASKFGEMPLDGRSLIASWLGKRQFTCTNSGYSPCTNSYGCCPTGDNCCTFGCCKSGQTCCSTSYCADQGETCCTFGTCPSGWGCCGVGTCYPLGGECCSTGNYCEPGNHCFLVRGLHSCCTDSHCTAHVSGGVTVTAAGFGISSTTRTVPPAGTTPSITAPSSDPSASLPSRSTSTVLTGGGTTAAPSSVTVGVYQYYYFTITWYYYSWFYTFSTFQSSTFTGSSYSQIDTSTVVSVYDTDSVSARSSFRSISATFSSPTPVAATQLSTLPSQTKASSTPTGIGAVGPGASSSSTSSSSSSSQSRSQSGATKLQTEWGISRKMAAFLLASLASGFLMLML